jgi:hypothetical protein
MPDEGIPGGPMGGEPVVEDPQRTKKAVAADGLNQMSRCGVAYVDEVVEQERGVEGREEGEYGGYGK